jgi:hypothetical protein
MLVITSAGSAERQLNALKRRGAKGGGEGWASGEKEFFDSENVFGARQVAAKGPALADCGSETQFWSALERMEQAEERKPLKRKFGKFGHMVRVSPLIHCTSLDLTLPCFLCSVQLNQRQSAASSSSSFRKASELTDKRLKTDDTGFSTASAVVLFAITVVTLCACACASRSQRSMCVCVRRR